MDDIIQTAEGIPHVEAFLKTFLASLTCHICHEVMHDPYSLVCGHTFCATCLTNWFRTLMFSCSIYTCPSCRIVVKTTPIPARQLGELYQAGLQLLENVNPEAVARLRAEDKEEDRVRSREQFHKQRWARSIRDETDGVERCAFCNWEIEDGICFNCRDRLENPWRDTPQEEAYSDGDSDDGDDDGDFDADEDRRPGPLSRYLYPDFDDASDGQVISNNSESEFDQADETPNSDDRDFIVDDEDEVMMSSASSRGAPIDWSSGDAAESASSSSESEDRESANRNNRCVDSSSDSCQILSSGDELERLDRQIELQRQRQRQSAGQQGTARRRITVTINSDGEESTEESDVQVVCRRRRMVEVSDDDD